MCLSFHSVSEYALYVCVCLCVCFAGTHFSGLLPHRLASRAGNMLSVNQEIPEELVQTEKAVLCPLYAGQMSVSYTLQQFTKFYMMMINAMTSVMAAI